MPPPFGPFNLNFEKNCLLYLNRQYADFAAFVAEKDVNSGVANIDSSSPYLERQVRAFVKAVKCLSVLRVVCILLVSQTLK